MASIEADVSNVQGNKLRHVIRRSEYGYDSDMNDLLEKNLKFCSHQTDVMKQFSKNVFQCLAKAQVQAQGRGFVRESNLVKVRNLPLSMIRRACAKIRTRT